MKKLKWQIFLGILLITASTIFYALHYLIFHDPHHIFLYLVADIAFVPIEVLIVILIIHKLLKEREKKKILDKLNMVIGIFFSEVGTDILITIANFDSNFVQIRKDLIIKDDWNEKEFYNASSKLRSHYCEVRIEERNLDKLAIRLKSKRDFLIRLLENPVILDHSNFTLLLRSLFHLEEELTRRINIQELTVEDQAHLASDIARAYKLLILQWIEYMKNLKRECHYLFQFALKTNPFNEPTYVD